MPTSFRPSPFWTGWLSAAAAGVVVFGLVLVLAPSLARHGFSLLVYGDPDRIDSFGPEAARYIALAHAVIGGVMVGWGSALLYVIRTLFAKGSPVAWKLISLSVYAWFVPDTAYSLLSAFWQNALLNTVFLALFATPLWATRGMRGHRD